MHVVADGLVVAARSAGVGQDGAIGIASGDNQSLE